MTARSENPVVLAAGGSGGHVFPAEALAGELVKRGHRLALITDRRGGVFGDALSGIETHHIRAGGVAGKSVVRLMQSAGALALGFVQARGILKRLQPKAVIGFGGYASVPTMLAASMMGFSTAIHEQNAVLGRANRLLAGRVGRIATSFDEVRAMPENAKAKVVRTGMPVRQAISERRGTPYPALMPADALNILVLGGSQGARILSDVVPEALVSRDKGTRLRLRVVQQCRPEDLDRVGEIYGTGGVEAELSSFFDDVPARLADAHLVISRSGASSVAEITALGRPAILVPYVHAVDDHQSANAYAVGNAGAGWLMPEGAFTPDVLGQRIDDFLRHPETLEKVARCANAAGTVDAAMGLADMVEDLLASNGANSDDRRAA